MMNSSAGCGRTSKFHKFAGTTTASPVPNVTGSEPHTSTDPFPSSASRICTDRVSDSSVVFSDFGTVERDIRIGTIRSSVGAGIRLVLPFFGQAPLAIDFAVPITKDDQDDTQLISFSFGFTQ